MKICPSCHAALEDNVMFCTNCGQAFAYGPGANGAAHPNAGYYPQDPYDHTAEFDLKDISENKVICMLVYLLGILGVLVALLASSTSKYAAFHVRQALKFTVVEALLGICAGLLAFTVIVPIAAAVMYVVLFVVKIICFFQICSGKAKEPAVIRGLAFLK